MTIQSQGKTPPPTPTLVETLLKLILNNFKILADNSEGWIAIIYPFGYTTVCHCSRKQPMKPRGHINLVR